MIAICLTAALKMLVAPDQAARQPPTFATSTREVRLDVLAMNGDAVLRGLTADDFEVRDNGILRTIRVIPADALPSEVLVLVDASESVKGPKLDLFRACARTIVQGMRAGDRAGLVTFSHTIRLRSPLTGTTTRLLGALENVEADGSTALFDAVFASLAISSRSHVPSVVLVLSDGRDNASWISGDDVVAAARLSAASIYAVSTSSIGADAPRVGEPPTWASVASLSDDEFLGRITRETGGRLFRATSPAMLHKQLAAVLDEIAARYLIGYGVDGTERGGWHKVEVRLRRRRGSVVTRAGYFVPGP